MVISFRRRKVSQEGRRDRLSALSDARSKGRRAVNDTFERARTGHQRRLQSDPLPGGARTTRRRRGAGHWRCVASPGPRPPLPATCRRPSRTCPRWPTPAISFPTSPKTCNGVITPVNRPPSGSCGSAKAGAPTPKASTETEAAAPTTTVSHDPVCLERAPGPNPVGHRSGGARPGGRRRHRVGRRHPRRAGRRRERARGPRPGPSAGQRRAAPHRRGR